MTDKCKDTCKNYNSELCEDCYLWSYTHGEIYTKYESKEVNNNMKLYIMVFDKCTNKYYKTVWEDITVAGGLIINNKTKECKTIKNMNKVLEINNTFEIFFTKIELDAHLLINEFMGKVLNYSTVEKEKFHKKIDNLNASMEDFYKIFVEEVNNLVTQNCKDVNGKNKQTSKQASTDK